MLDPKAATKAHYRMEFAIRTLHNKSGRMSTCLQCGRPMPLLHRLLGKQQFCSAAHRKLFQEEYNQSALLRLQAVGEAMTRASAPAPPPPAPASETDPPQCGFVCFPLEVECSTTVEPFPDLLPEVCAPAPVIPALALAQLAPLARPAQPTQSASLAGSFEEPWMEFVDQSLIDAVVRSGGPFSVPESVPATASREIGR